MALRTNLSDWALTPFESNAHMMEAMRDPQYRRSPEFVACVEAKVALMARGAAVTAHNDHSRIVVGTGVIGNTRSAAARSEASERLSAEEQLAAIYGPLSIRHESRAKSQAALKAASDEAGSQGNRGDTLTRVTARSFDVD